MEETQKLPQTLKEKLDYINSMLDNYEDGLGLPKFETPHNNTEEVRKYINMSRTELESLSPAQCAEIGFILVNYSLYLQRGLNRETSILNWAQKTLHYNAVGRCKDYRGSFTQQESLAAQDDEYCKQLLKLISQKTLKVDRLQFISNSIKGLAEQLRSLQQAKAGKT